MSNLLSLPHASFAERAIWPKELIDDFREARLGSPSYSPYFAANKAIQFITDIPKAQAVPKTCM
jgi:hypothetical protein